MHRKFLLLLEQERAAICCADFDKVDSLAVSKQTLFDQTMRRVRDRKDLSEIQSALSRNQILLEAAISGVSSARTRLKALRDVRDTLRIYDERGNMAQVAERAPGLSKRS